VKIEFGKDDKFKIHVLYNPELIRYSFATHLLEAGTDLRYIQELLVDHKDLKTIEIYTHVSAKNLFALKDSLDSILAGGGK